MLKSLIRLIASTFALVALAACAGSSISSPVLQATQPPPTGATPPPPSMDTHFTESGRYIDFSQAPAGESVTRVAGVKVFLKGMVYSPTPIGAFPFDSPLKDSNAAVWSRDLPLMRAMGVNAIHVYNVTPPPYDSGTGPIYQFLNAAWNNGDHPIYVLMSIFFNGDKLFDQAAVSALATQYHDLDKKYATYPAVLGTSIGNEIGAGNFITNPAWWKAFNQLATAAKQGFKDGGDGDKIVTTSEADGNIGAVQRGEQYGAAVDAWGINIYRGRTFTNLFDQIRSFTKKPVMLTEYGASAAYHPMTHDKYFYTPNDPNAIAHCERGGGATNVNDVAELPLSSGSNPNMAGLTDYVQNTTTLLEQGYAMDGVVSGGFYFEWTDEWWKANQGNANAHLGNVAFNGAFPGCNEDQGWYGINAVSKTGGVDALTPRPTLSWLRDTWAKIASIP